MNFLTISFLLHCWTVLHLPVHCYNVSDVGSFLTALRDPDVQVITLQESLRLRQYNEWDVIRDLHVTRPVIIEGAEGTDNQIVLDMGSISNTMEDYESNLTPTELKLTFRNLYLTGLPYSNPTSQSEFIRGPLSIENSVVEILDYDTTTVISWQRLVQLPRLQLNTTAAQLIRPTTEDFCNQWCRVSCGDGSYVFVEDVEYSTSDLEDLQTEFNASVQFRNSMLIIPTVTQHTVNSTRSFRNALLDQSGHMTEIIIDGELEIVQWELDCPISVSRDLVIRGRTQSHPPLDLLNFQFSFGCIQVSRRHSIVFRDLLFNNTMFDSPLTPIEVGWQTLVPLLDLDPGSSLRLENTVLDITVDPDVDIDSNVLLQYFEDRDMNNIDGYRLPTSETTGQTVSQNWCVSEFIGSSPDCFTQFNCNSLARCPNGALYVYTVTYQFPFNPVLQSSYSIVDSLIKIREIGLDVLTPPDRPSTPGNEDSDSKKAPVLIIVLVSCLSILGLFVACGACLLLHLRTKSRQEKSEYGDQDFIKINRKQERLRDFCPAREIQLNDPPLSETTPQTRSGTSDKMQKTAERLFGKITLTAPIGEGGFGKVYKGTWNGAIVAVKVMLTSEGGSSHLHRQKVEREIQVFSKLRHPNIVNHYQSATRKISRYTTLAGIEAASCSSSSEASDLATSDTQTPGSEPKGCSIETWIVMEYCDKGTLSEALKNNVFFEDAQQRKVNMRWAILTCREIATGFEYLHDNHTIHGDLKPHNILLATSSNDSRQFTAKVTDFGVSRQVVGSHIYTGTVGTMHYMAPEQLEDGRLSEKADVYAFGLIMWQIVSGTSPFKNLTMADIYRKVVVEKWRPQFDDNVADGYACLAKQCWAHSPKERPSFQSIRETLELLERALSRSLSNL